MRVVVASVPQTGHITPLLPLAEALARQGDDVVFASGADAEDAVGGRGLTFRPAGPAFGEWYSTLQARTRGVPGDGLPPARVESYFLPRLFGEIGTALMVDDLLEVCREPRADLLVFDPFVFAGPLVASVAGVPAVHHAIGPLVDPEVALLVTDAVSPIWREFGLSVPEAAGTYQGTTITICPTSLDPAGAEMPRTRPMRPVALPAASTAGRPPSIPDGDDPLVYVTLGTFSNNPEVFRQILHTLAGEAVRVVATVGKDLDAKSIGAVSANVRVEAFIPQAELLPHCRAVVHHAGAGTTFGVLAHGLPAVALPQSADNFTIAERLARAGAAFTLMPGEVNEVSLRDALRQVVAGDGYRAAARRLAAEIAAMPPPEAVAADLKAARAEGHL